MTKTVQHLCADEVAFMFLQDRSILDKTFKDASEEEKLSLVYVLLDAFEIQHDTALALASENKDLSDQNSDLARKLKTARNSTEAIITNLTKMWNLYLGMNEVFGKAIDLLKQDSSNSNWSSSSNRIKPFGKSANSYQKRMQGLNKQIKEKYDNIDVALSWFYGSPQLFKRIAEAAQKSKDKQAALEAQKCQEAMDAMVAAMMAQASSDAAAEDKESSSDDKPSGDHVSGDNTAPVTTSEDNAAPMTVPEGGDTKAAETATTGSGEPDSTADAGDSVDVGGSMDDEDSEDESESDGEESSDGVSDASKDPDADGKGKGKPGGKIGHPGSNKVVTDKPDKVVVNLGDHCPECPHYAECCDRAIKKGKRVVEDVEFKKVIIAYYKGSVWCKEHGCYVHGKHPENVRGRFQYGVVLQALIICLYAIGYVSIERIHGLLKDVMGVSMSTGTIMNIIVRAGAKGVVYWDYIRCMVRSAKVAGSDETSAFVKGDGELKRYWIHTVVSKLFTYLYCSPFRGYQAIIEDGILVDFLGVLVHDCWGSYFKIDTADHATCGAHGTRELHGVQDRDPDQTWAQEMIDLFQKMLKRKREFLERALDKGLLEAIGSDTEVPQLSPEEIAAFYAEYDEILKKGFAQNGIPFDLQEVKGGKKYKKTKTVNLLLRLRDLKDEWLRFITDLRVPFTNNWSETSLRGLKVHQHVSHFTRSVEGLTIRLILSSITQSAKKHKLSGFDAIIKMLQGMSPQDFYGREIPAEVLATIPERAKTVVIPGKKPEAVADPEAPSCTDTTADADHAAGTAGEACG